MNLRFYTWLSIYVRCANVAKFRRTHLHAINDRLGTFDATWEISHEKDTPSEVRAVTMLNHEAGSKEEAIHKALALAGTLYPGVWNITGLGTLARKAEPYLLARADIPEPLPRPPALTTVQLEMQTGWVTRADGVWYLPERS